VGVAVLDIMNLELAKEYGGNKGMLRFFKNGYKIGEILISNVASN